MANNNTATPPANPFTVFQNTRGATLYLGKLGRLNGFLQTPPCPRLTSINPTYGTTFNTFSPLRIFTPLGSNITDVTFSAPGSRGTIPATVSGFGAVFTNVNLPNTSRLEFFDQNDNQVFSANVLKGTVPVGSLSFLGVTATAGEEFSRVRIITGTTALGPTHSIIPPGSECGGAG